MCDVIGKKLFVNGMNLYYERAGHGSHILLLCPGALGELLG